MASPPMNARKPDPPSVSEAERKTKEAERKRKYRAKKKANASTPAQAPAMEYASTLARTSSLNAEEYATWTIQLAATINESHSKAMIKHAETMSNYASSFAQVQDNHSQRQAEFLDSAVKAYVVLGGAPPTTQRSHRRAFSSPACI